MIVLGTRRADWIGSVRAAVLDLVRAAEQLSGLEPVPDTPDTYKVTLAAGGHLYLTANETKIELWRIGSDGEKKLHIRDETVAFDEEDRKVIDLSEVWLEHVIGRWLEIVADYSSVDVLSGQVAQLMALPPQSRTAVVEAYRYVADHMRRSGNPNVLSAHLTLPTDYWTANLVCTDNERRHYLISQDPKFDEMMQNLPEACEILALGDGSAGYAEMQIVPLYLTQVRLEHAPALEAAG